MKKIYEKIFLLVFLGIFLIEAIFYYSSMSKKLNFPPIVLIITVISFIIFSFILNGIKFQQLLLFLFCSIFLINYLFLKTSFSGDINYDIAPLLTFFMFTVYIDSNLTTEILRKFLKVILVTMIFFYIFSKLNIIPNLSVQRWGETTYRQTLGFSSPNTLGIFYFSFVTVTLIYIKNLKNLSRNYAYLFLFFTTFLLYKLSDSRASMLLAFLLIFAAFIFSKINKEIKVPGFILSLILLFLLITNFILINSYGKNMLIFQLNDIFSGRLAMAQYYLDAYNVHLLGQNLSEQQAMLTNQGNFIRNENWVLDNGYMRILINQGYLFFISFFGYIFFKLSKRKFSLLSFSIIIAIFSLGILERYAFNIFLFPALFLIISNYKESMPND